MEKQKGIDKYNLFGAYLEEIRRGKKIPLRVFDENGLSSRTFQRFVQGKSDIRITDLAIIIEILSLSPYECTGKLMELSQTVTFKINALSTLNQLDFENSTLIISDFKNYIKRTSFTLGKEEALYKVISTDYLLNPRSQITKEEISLLEQKILERIKDATVYTLYDLDFMSYLQINGINQVPKKLFLKVLKAVNGEPLTDVNSLRIVERALIGMLIHSVRTDDDSNFLLTTQLFENYVISDHNWYMFMWKKIVVFLKHKRQHQQMDRAEWLHFKQNILSALSVIIAESQANSIKKQLQLLENALLID